ncbi:MAG: COX15/CtaA family protein [Deltaproteobacteria bacterium]|nr:COX15/CtaA family protein [Deltaproteobacteria bacterium]
MSADRAPASARAVSPRGLGWGFAVLTAVTFSLMVLGALVRAHGAGLACPDWPLCFGQLVPEFDMRIAFEWSHRLLASGVSLGLAGLTAAVWWRPELWRRLARSLAGAWVLLGVQVLLGGLTVLLLLAPWTVTGHLLTGTAFCTVLLWISRDLLEWGKPVFRPRPSRAVRTFAVTSVALLLGQLVLGGLVSSQGAGLACASFPSCDGDAFIPTLSGLVGIHVLHRLNGLLLLASVIALSMATRGVGRVGLLAWTAVRLLILQIGVGVLNVLLLLPVEVTGLHTALAAILALTLGLLLRELVYAAPGRVEGTRAAGSDLPVEDESQAVRPLASSG